MFKKREARSPRGLKASRPGSFFRVALMLALSGSFALAPQSSLAKKKAEAPAEVDVVALATRLFHDGFYDRAEATLATADLEDENVDIAMVSVLQGLIALKKQDYPSAASHFEAAIAAGHPDPLVQVNLARAYFGAKDYRRAIAALNRAPEIVGKDPNALLLLSRSYWEIKNPARALEILRQGAQSFPDLIEFPRSEIHTLIELGLFQEVSAKSKDFLERSDLSADDIAAMGEALRQTGKLSNAASILSTGRVRFPKDLTLGVQLSRVLLDQWQTLSAALVLEQVALSDSSYLIEAAELFRRAERLDRALFLNQRILDQEKKMKQRLQILLQMERFEMVAAMESRLTRLALVDNDEIRYALAYALFQVGDFEAAQRHIRFLKDPSVFEKGIELRKAISDCEAAGWLCH